MKRILFHYWGWLGALLFWCALLFINGLDLFPSLQFRGCRYVGVDFDQYYAAGIAAYCSLWDVMYPDPAHYTKGHRPAEAPYRESMATELQIRGASSQTKNIYPPPTALLFCPLGLWNYASAQRVFVVVLAISVICLLILLQRECQDLGIPLWAANTIVFFAATGLPVSESVMLRNITPAVGLFGILALRGIRSSHSFGTVAGFVGAGLTKGFSVAWIPALFAWKRWRTIAWGGVVAILTIILCRALGCKLGVWEEYAKDVLPISRGNLYRIGDSNLGFPSFFAWLFHWNSVPRPVSRVFTMTQLLCFGTAYGLSLKASRCRANVCFAQGIALFCSTLVFQTFSTVCWPHYSVNILPFLPVAIAAAGNRKASLLVLLVGFSMTWFPIGNAFKYLFHVPILGFGRFFGYVILIAWSFGELVRLTRDSSTWKVSGKSISTSPS